MANHSSILSWRIPWTEDPGRLQSMGSDRSHFHMTTFTKAIIGLFVRTGLLHIQTQSLTVWPLAQVNFSTGIPPFSKVTLQYNTTKFTVTKDLHQYLLLLTEKNLEFFILWWKGKILSSVCFAATITEVTCTLSRHHQTPSLGTTLNINCYSPDLCLWAYVLYLSLSCASFVNMWSKVIASLLHAIYAKRFHRRTLLPENMGNLCKICEISLCFNQKCYIIFPNDDFPNAS